MFWWKRIITAQNVQVIIEMTKFSELCKQGLLNLSYDSRDNNEQLRNFQIDTNLIINNLTQLNYPAVQQIIQSIQTQNSEQLLRDYLDLSQWTRTVSLTSEQYDLLYQAQKQLRNFMNQIDSYEFTEKDAEDTYNKVISETSQYMEQIKQNILGAIRRIPTWSTPLLRIIPNPVSDTFSYKDDYTQSTDSATVEFGYDEMAPNFSYFANADKVEIDDVLEAGDTDFFTDNKVQSDYFALVRELKNPGSTQKSGKFLRLYTARPVKDRALYQDAKQVPSGIFLSNSLNHVEGLAVDLGGARDIWKVTINEQYLLNTLDGPGVKYYQVVGDNFVPVKQMSLLIPAENSDH